MSKIVYTYGDGLYINLTNKCPCNCKFCIRQKSKGYGSADNLWLEKEPGVDEVMSEFKKFEAKAAYKEVVFCGYGEPFSAFSVLMQVCDRIRKITSLPIRINTNGLGDLINNMRTAPLLSGLVDIVSISLNTSDPDHYLEICKPIYGSEAYPAILSFATDCKKYVSQVQFTVVDTISPEDIKYCYTLAKKLSIELRVRKIIEQ